MKLSTPLEMRNDLLGKKLVGELEKRNFEAYYCKTSAEAMEKAFALIPEGSSVSWGGSVTIREMGLTDAFHAKNYKVVDRDLAKDADEKFELQRQALMVDCYVTSTNAITEDGVLVNIDGVGNRVAAMSFGPKNVVVIVGMNKVEKTAEDALTRVRTYAAPVNSMRFMGKTPCAVDGVCHNCKSPESICNQMLITRNCRPAKRIKVILVGEELGF
ncbi:lactate utilization protein [Chakrabartyella piscis]|uniref:lactate utilization protein n=1 Tax=Chakrabartyella piscis TaxID=2918914 RepID=UPI002958836F|nr:lactate utilization protein [Chakrabartyella piscis]